MSHTLTETRVFEPVVVPDDGEAAVASAPGVPASRVTLEEVIQTLTNRTASLLAGRHGQVEGLQADITASGTDRTWTLRCAKLLAITRAGGSGLLDPFVVGSPLALSLGTLGASDEYFVYAYNAGGTLTLEVSGTAPEPSLDFKSGDTSRVYLGSFLTDGAGRAIPQSQCGRRYVLGGAATITGTPLDCGSTAADGSLAVPARAPSTAKLGTFEASVSRNATPTAIRTAGVRAVGGGGGGILFSVQVSEVWNRRAAHVALPIIGGQIELFTSAQAELYAQAALVGWEE